MKIIVIIILLYLIPTNALAAPIVPGPKPPPAPACIFSVPGYEVTNPLGIKFCNIADIINNLIPFIFLFSGLTLFIMLLISGFAYLTSGGDEKKVTQAKGRITAALAGFIIIIAAYWLAQIAEFIFHIQIF